MSGPPADHESRSRAALERARNVVVTAGAGTGKTTLLVERIVHLLLRHDGPVPIGNLLALTFSRRAAGEMRARLRDVLTRLLAFARGDAEADPSDVWGAAYLRHEKGGREGVALRLRDALAAIEDAQVGTIHSFAASLLRAHPLESGVDPAFREDDGTLFEERFRRAWRAWLAVELGSAAPDAKGWRALLAKVSLPDLALLARALCGEAIDLAALGRFEEGAVPAVWREGLAREAKAILAARAGAARPVKADEMVASALSVLAATGKGSPPGEAERES
ncbi:MAG: UvrD-helicase domain-containing protein, partial [Planctomycetes bacterium]|nr:UvrD-helicase domain-containing protein [Planctomycetota bacterium]